MYRTLHTITIAHLRNDVTSFNRIPATRTLRGVSATSLLENMGVTNPTAIKRGAIRDNSVFGTPT